MSSDFYVQPLARTKSFDFLNARLSTKPTDVLKNEANDGRNLPVHPQPLTIVDSNSCNRPPVGRRTEQVHLLLSEMLLQTAELNSWNSYVEEIDFSTDPGPISRPDLTRQLLNIRSDCPTVCSRCRASSSSSFSDLEINPTVENRKADHSDVEESGDPAVDQVVHSLLRHFKRKLTVDGKDLVYMLTEVDNQQDPERVSDLLSSWRGSGVFSLEVQSSSNQTDAHEWTPPRREFIYDLQDVASDLTSLIHQQKDQCAGCRRPLQPPAHTRRTLYCYYYNKLFCPLCHQGSKARIPARILHQWNFKEYPVCDLAFNFLREIEDQPVFDVHALDTALNRKVRNLKKTRAIRLKISHLWQFIRLCPTEVVTKYGLLRTMFEAVPSRFLSLEYVDVYSLVDFERIENGNLIEMLEPLAICGTSHVLNCENCEDRGFLCQICFAPTVLFPFQDNVYRCEGCGALSHQRCYDRQMLRNGTVFCERCKRIHQKRFFLARTFGFARPLVRRVWSRFVRKRRT